MNEKVKNLLAEALQMTNPQERRAWLERACAGDEELRREVETLLNAYEQAGDFFDHTKPFPAPDPGEPEGTRIGRYKLLERIGEGGFGTVWMAEQEEPVRRRVALKIIKLGMDTKEVVARFEAERQALAMMDHPNIARVFDGGATEKGRPYFVMELVKGIPITQYCDANKLSTPERLALFMQVCHAVQHAHQKGVIHRDLKPSNILVTVQDDKPVPKVIDFGVAKATQVRLTEKTVFTRFHQFIGTPAYMSPEQAGLGSLDVDTRSDIYSLGVLLYELLTGCTPFDMEKLLAAGYDAVMRVIREEEPPKPSTRLSTLAEEELNAVAAKRSAEPAGLNRTVRGDLDWIVMKALEKERGRRYGSASAFAEDMERYLRHDPVLAVPPSALYRSRRFLLRNKVAAGFTAALVLSLFGGTVLSWWQAGRAEGFAREADGQRQLATNEAARALRFADESERARNQAEAGAYASRVVLASQSVQAGDLSQADRLLEACPQLLRQWEWHYLKRQCQPAYQVPHSNEVWSLAASPDGHWLASLDRASRLLLWNLGGDLSEPPRIWQVGGYPREPLLLMNKALAFSHDSRSLAYTCPGVTGRNECVLALISIGSTNSPRVLLRISNDKFRSLCLSFSPDDQRLMIGGSDGLVRSYDVTSGLQVASFPILAAAFSQDGSRVASLGVARLSWAEEPQSAHALKVFDTLTGRELLAITNLAELPTLFSLALSADGKRVAAGFVEMVSEPQNESSAIIVQAERGLVVVWDISTRQEVFRRSLSKAGPIDLDFFPDGRQLAVACGSVGLVGISAGEIALPGIHLPIPGKVLILDVLSGEEVVSLRGHLHDVNAIAFIDHGRRLASASSDRTVRLWELGASRIIPLGGRLIPLGGQQINSRDPWDPCLTPLSSDGRMIAVSTLDTNWDVVDLVTGKTLGSAPIPEGIQDVVLTKSPPRLVCLSDTALRYWDLASGQKSWSLNITNLGLGAKRLAVSSDGRRVALAAGMETKMGDIALIEARSGRPIIRTNLPGIGAVAFSLDSRLLVAGDRYGNLRVWNAVSGDEMLCKRAAELIPGLSVLDLLLNQQEDSHLDVEDERIPVTAVAVSPDGSQIATAAGAYRGELRLWDLASAQPKWVRPLAPTVAGALAMAFSPDGGRVAVAWMSSVGSATDLVMYDAVSGQELVRLPSRTMVESLAFSPDGARLWGVTLKGMLVSWDAPPWPGLATPPAIALRSSVVETLEHRNSTPP